MIFKLNQGDTIEVIAPAFAHAQINPQDVGETIQSFGYIPRFSPNMVNRALHPFCANTDEERYNNLLSALKSEDSKVIWAFRGGYGSTILLPLLDNHDFSGNPKVLIGFSDITALSLYFYKKYKWPYIHSRVLTQYVNNVDAREEIPLIQKILSGDWDKIEYALKPLNAQAKVGRTIIGEIIGGNLSLVQCSLGTNWQIDAKDKILFLEEVRERGYKVHRMLVHLKQAGVFDGIKALVIGDITCQPEPGGESLCEEAIKDFIHGVDFPVVRSNEFGHGAKNYPLIMGVEARLALGELSYIGFENVRD